MQQQAVPMWFGEERIKREKNRLELGAWKMKTHNSAALFIYFFLNERVYVGKLVSGKGKRKGKVTV